MCSVIATAFTQERWPVGTLEKCLQLTNTVSPHYMTIHFYNGILTELTIQYYINL